MPFAYGYVRNPVSKKGTSLDQQKCEAMGHFRKHLWRELHAGGFEWGAAGFPEPGGWFVEAAMAKGDWLFQRKAAFDMLRHLQPGDAVLFACTGQCFRTVDDATKAIDDLFVRRARIILIDVGLDTADEDIGCYMKGIEIGQAIRKSIQRETQLDNFAITKKDKKWHDPTHSRPPYGFKLSGKKAHRRWVPDEEQRAIGRLIVEWRNAGWTFDEIYFHLCSQKVRMRDGKEWSSQSIRKTYRLELALQEEEKKLPSGQDTSNLGGGTSADNQPEAANDVYLGEEDDGLSR